MQSSANLSHHITRQKKLQPYDYIDYGVPVEHMKISPFKVKLPFFFNFRSINTVNKTFAAKYQLDDDQYKTIEFEEKSIPIDSDNKSATQISSICSFCNFVNMNGSGGLYATENIVKGTVLLHTQFKTKSNDQVRDAHEKKLLSGLDEDDLFVYMNYLKYNVILYHVSGVRKKRSVIKSSEIDYDKWIIIMKNNSSYQILCRYFEGTNDEPERCKIIFTEDQISDFFAAFDDVENEVQDYNYIGNMNPASKLVSKLNMDVDSDDSS